MIQTYCRLLTCVFLGSVVLPPVATVSSTYSLEHHLSGSSGLKIILYCLAAVASSIGFLVLVRKYGAVLSREALNQANFLDSLPGSLVPPAIVIAAGLSLFLATRKKLTRNSPKPIA